MKKGWIIGLLLIGVVVSTALFFETSESEADFDNCILLNCEHGSVINALTEEEYSGSEFVSPLNLKFIPNHGYEFVQWCVVGECEYTSEGNILQITNVVNTVTISVETRNLSTSQGLTQIIDVDSLLGPTDVLVNNWSFASANLVRVGSSWQGMPSVPLIVGDTVYVRAGGILYALDISNGTIKNYVSSVGAVDFYHYLSYGNGVIFDTIAHCAYDLDLNYLYDLPGNLEYATYQDNYFYGFIKTGTTGSGYALYSIFKTSSDCNKDLSNGVKVNLSQNSEQFQVFAQYGQFSSFTQEKGWMFFLQADLRTGTTGYRALTAYNPSTEKSVTVELDGFTGMPWDDGWLTFYNDYFYLTAYTAGLFDGVIKGLEDKRTSLMWVKFDFDKGVFETPHFQNIQNELGGEFRGIASGLVIKDGRGYLNVRASADDTLGSTNDVGTCMISFDILDDGTPVPREHAKSYMTHGGIVLNIAHESEGVRHIYLIPYDSGAQGIYIFTDELIDGKWVLNSKYTKLSPTQREWCSQGIRAGPNGEIIYYVDRGYIDCYISADQFIQTVLMIDGDSLTSFNGTGANIVSVLKGKYDSVLVQNGTVTIGSETYSAYGLNEVSRSWDRLDNLYDSSWSGKSNSGVLVCKYRYVALVKEGTDPHFYSITKKGWYYENESGDYVKCILSDYASVDSALGKTLHYYPSDPYGLILPSSIILNPGDNEHVHITDKYEWSCSVSDNSVVEVVKEGSDVILKYLSEGETTLTVLCRDNQYSVKVQALPGSVVDDGFEVITSNIEKVDGDYHINIETVSKTKDDEQIITSTTKTYGPDSILVKEEYVQNTTTQTRDPVTDELYSESQSIHYIIENGVKIVDTISESSSSRIVKTDATIVTVKLEVVWDKISDTKNREETKTIEQNSVKIVESNIFDLNKDEYVPIYSKTMVENVRDVEINADIKDNMVFITLGSEDVLDLVLLSSVLENNLDKCSYNIAVCDVLSKEQITSLMGDGVVVSIVTDAGSLNLSGSVLNQFDKDLVLNMGSVSVTTLNDKQKLAAGDAYLYEIDLKCGTTSQHEFGMFNISLNCDIGLQTGKELKVWRIGANGEKTYATNVQYGDGKVTFDADHLSLYAVGYESSKEIIPEIPEESINPTEDGSDGGNDNGMVIYAGIGVVAILAILGIALVVRKSRA